MLKSNYLPSIDRRKVHEYWAPDAESIAGMLAWSCLKNILLERDSARRQVTPTESARKMWPFRKQTG